MQAVAKPKLNDENAEAVDKPHARLNVLAKPWPNVADEFCRDEIYMQDQPCPRAPSNQCEKCGKSFGSCRALGNHMIRDHQRNL